MKKLTVKTRIILFVAALFCLTAWLVWGNLSLQVTEYTVSSSKIPGGFHGFRIVQISDLHNAEFGENNHRLLNNIRKLQPDIIVITGDLIDSRRTNLEIAVAFTEAAAEIAPTYYVPGNHEARFSSLSNIHKRLSDAGAQLLLKKNVLLEKDGQKIRLSGIWDAIFYPDGQFPDEVKALLPNDGIYTILLSHQPEEFPAYVEAGADLVLAGHTHGGQFRLPFLGGIFTLSEGFFPKYDGGVLTEGDTTMVISRGLGQSVIPLRINNRPEIVVITLEKVQ